MTIADELSRLGACGAAIEWVGARTDARAAWQACPRGDWLLWLAAKLGVDRKLVVRAACACARTALPYVPEGELRPLRAIEAAEAWTRGEASLEQVRAASAAADAAAYAVDASAAASYAAADSYYAYSYASAAADAAAYAVDASAAHAAVAYAAVAYAAADDADARAQALAEHATLVRQIIPWAEVEREWTK